MARKRILGFELGSAADEQITLTGTASLQGTTKRTGDYALRCNPASSALGFAEIRSVLDTGAAGGLTDPISTSGVLWTRFFFRLAAITGSREVILLVYNNATGLAAVIVDASGKLVLRDSPNATDLGTSATTIAVDTWYEIAVKFSTSAVGSNWELWVNGVKEIDAAPVSHSALNPTRWLLGRLSTVAAAADFYFDDFAADDASRPLASGIYRLDPNANGNYTAFVAGTGSGGYQEVDDYPAAGNDGDTSYVTTSTYLDQESAQCESCDGAGVPSASEIAAVAAVVVARDEGTTLAWAAGIRSGTTDSLKTSLDGANTYGGTASVRHALFLTDPATSAAWTRSAVDAAEPVIKHDQNAVRALRLTAMALLVEAIDVAVTGSGAPAAGASTVAGSGTSGSTGSGAPAAGAAAAAGSGVSGSTGAGAPAAGAAAVAGAGASGSTGAGAPASGAAAASGAGVSGSPGAGAPAAGSSTTAGAGASGSTGSGSPGSGSSTVAGDNQVVEVTSARRWRLRLVSPQPHRLRLASPAYRLRLVSPKPYHVRQAIVD